MVRLPAKTHKALKKECDEQGRKLEWAIAKAVDTYLAMSHAERTLLAHYIDEIGIEGTVRTAKRHSNGGDNPD